MPSITNQRPEKTRYTREPLHFLRSSFLFHQRRLSSNIMDSLSPSSSHSTTSSTSAQSVSPLIPDAETSRPAESFGGMDLLLNAATTLESKNNKSANLNAHVRRFSESQESRRSSISLSSTTSTRSSENELNGHTIAELRRTLCCPNCQKQFRRFDALQRHMRKASSDYLGQCRSKRGRITQEEKVIFRHGGEVPARPFLPSKLGDIPNAKTAMLLPVMKKNETLPSLRMKMAHSQAEPAVMRSQDCGISMLSELAIATQQIQQQPPTFLQVSLEQNSSS